MAYVRKRGNQLAIVHGERDPESGKVCQRVLFTLYSKKEAIEALDDTQGRLLQSLLEFEYPEIKFAWKRIWWEVARNLDGLPVDYEYRESEMVKKFRADLCSFMRQLVLNEPQWLFSSAELLRQHRYELEYLIELIGWRLKLCDTKPDEWNRDNEYYWRHRLRGREVPPDTEEEISTFYGRGDLDRAEAILRLLVDAFPNDAENHNTLGLIALDRGNLEEAAQEFTTMMELARRRLPRRLTPRLFVNNHRGKPYRRGLGNLVVTMNRLGRCDEALALADQLEYVCGDDDGAASLRAEIHLNRGAWEEAVKAARAVRGLWPEMSFIAAMASFELGRTEESIADFLHGACNHPGAVQLVAGRRTEAPKTRDEARDQRVGADLFQNLTGYLDRYGSRLRRFFGSVTANPKFGALMAKVEETRRRRDEERKTSSRIAWNRLLSMESPRFAEKRAVDLYGPLSSGKTGDSGAQAR